MQWHKEIPQTFRCAPKIIHQGVQMCDLIYMKLLSRQNSFIGTEVTTVLSSGGREGVEKGQGNSFR